MWVPHKNGVWYDKPQMPRFLMNIRRRHVKALVIICHKGRQDV